MSGATTWQSPVPLISRYTPSREGPAGEACLRAGLASMDEFLHRRHRFMMPRYSGSARPGHAIRGWIVSL